MLKTLELEEKQRKLEYCTFDDDLPKFKKEELSNKKDSFEWYYFDIDTGDVQIVVRFILKDTSIHDVNPAIEFILRKEHEEVITRIKDYDDGYKYEKNDEGAIIEIGKNKLGIYKDHENNIQKYFLQLQLDEIELNLKCTPVHRGFKVSGKGDYLKEKTNEDIYSSAVFPAPRMKGVGDLILGTYYQKVIVGQGYHDHPWGTTSLMYSHKEWHWGRIYTSEFTVFFTKVIPSDGYQGELNILYFAKRDETEPKLEDGLEITSDNWKLKFMSEFPFIFRFPRKLSIKRHNPSMKSSKENLSVETNFEEILLLIKIYIRIKAKAVIKENGNVLIGVGWVEYLKIPSPFIIQKLFKKILMFFVRIKYNKDKWRKKKDYEHIIKEWDIRRS